MLLFRAECTIPTGQANVSLDPLVRNAEALGAKTGDLFFREKLPVQRVLIKENSRLSKLSSNDLAPSKKTSCR